MISRILIADDDPRFRDFVKRLLGQDMQVVGEPVTAVEAVAQAVALRPHVVLLDIELPGSEATPFVAQRIRAAHPEVKVILLTAKDTDVYLSSTGKTGADLLMHKRDVRTEILGRIRAVLGGLPASWDPREGREKDPDGREPKSRGRRRPAEPAREAAHARHAAPDRDEFRD